MLTTSIDAVTGTSGNDTFIATQDNTGADPVNTLNVGDELNGGAGVDTLKITTASTTGIDLSLGTISNVEKLLIVDANNSINGTVNVASNAFSSITLQNLNGANVENIVEGGEIIVKAQAGTGTDGSYVYTYSNGTAAESVSFTDSFIGNSSATSGGAQFYHGDNTNGLLSAATSINATLNLIDANSQSNRGDYVDFTRLRRQISTSSSKLLECQRAQLV